MMRTVLSKLALPFTDAYGFAFCLNIALCAVAVFSKNVSVAKIALIWTDSFWSFSSFTLHIVMTFVCGYALAVTPAFNRFMAFVLRFVSDKALLPFLTVFVSCVSLLNWGMGLLSSAMLCRAVMQQKKRVCYPALVMAAYSGFLVWHGGLTGSAPLLVASQPVLAPGIFGPISLNETIFAPWHKTMLVTVIVVMSCAAWGLAFFKKGKISTVHQVSEQDNIPQASGHERVLANILCVGGLVLSVIAFAQNRVCGLSMVNVMFFMLALFLHQGWTPFTHVMRQALGSAVPIIVQFPLYAAAVGVLKHTSLGADLAYWFVSGSSKESLPVLTFLSAGIINLLIPSGGGQWIVQGPIVLHAAQQLGVPYAHVVMALSWGDAWTNLIQPFWMMPVIHLCRMTLKDVFPYALYFLVVSGCVLVCFFLALGGLTCL